MSLSPFADHRWRYLTILIVLAITALTLAFWPRRQISNERNPHRSLYVDAEYAISGNKVQIDTDGEKDDDYIIYIGLRAPLRGHPLFEASLNRNNELVKGKRLRLRFGKKKYDDKGRMLVYVFVDDLFVNEILVREGLAYVRLTDKNYRFKKRLLEAQTEARLHRRGLWKIRKPSHESQYIADRKYGNFHRPQCEECAKIKPERKIVLRGTTQAFKEGLAPCTKCKP